MAVKVTKMLGIHSVRSKWKALLILIAGLILTIIFTIAIYRQLEKQAREQLRSISVELGAKIDARLRAHALILRAGASYMAVADTVTREDWRAFIGRLRIDVNLPGIEGMGYSVLIQPSELQEHISKVRQEGFPDYNVKPEGERDIYSSILYLEPFTDRNLRAFGYDMFSEPVRRRAMELARDNDVAMLTGKVNLVQETSVDVQSGTLMYVPYYEPEMPSSTVDERRLAIRGWVYNPYRMRDLMGGILGRWDEEHQERVRLRIYDDSLSVDSLLYDSQPEDMTTSLVFSTRKITTPVEFNGKKWVLEFSQSYDYTIFDINVIITFISGLIISVLLYLLALSYFKVSNRSRQIRFQNKQLSRLNATKDKFFSIIAHDLKSPFNSIIGFSRILMEQVEKKKYNDVARYAEIIHQSSNSAMDLLMNLMEWSQSQTGRMVFKPVRFDFNELLLDVEILFKDNARLKSIEIRNEVPENMVVYADYQMIGTVLRNLISNALKFTNPGGNITIRASEESHGHLITVSDTGIGIHREILSKLFRIDKSYSTKGTQNEKGTGLGLILCKEFVEKHGGKIWVDSNAASDAPASETGSTFYFSIPSEKTNKK